MQIVDEADLSMQPAEEFVAHYLVLIPCQSFSDFQKMLDLKVSDVCFFYRRVMLRVNLQQGVRRMDQNDLLDVFLTKTSTMTELSDTSSLSALDMDANVSTSLVVSSPQPPMTSLPAPGTVSNSGHGILAAASAFGSLPMWASSRDGSQQASRAGTPLPSSGAADRPAARTVAFADAEPSALQQQQQKLGVKLGRFFGRDGR